jgi:hypothetical protein
MKIIKLFKEGESGKNVTEKYDVGVSPISDIKKNSELVLNFVSILERENGSTIKKTMKKAENGKVEAAIYQWFIQRRKMDGRFQGWFFVKKC